MRVTRHPYAVDGWGVGELWVGDGRDRRRARPPAPPRRRSDNPLRPPDHPQGHPGCPYRHAIGNQSREGDGFVAGSAAKTPQLLRRRAGLLRRRGARPRLGDAVPARRRRGAADRPLGRGRHLRRARRARRAIRAPPARPAPSAPQNRFSLFVPCHRVVAPVGSAATARSGSTTSAVSSGSRAPCPL